MKPATVAGGFTVFCLMGGMAVAESQECERVDIQTSKGTIGIELNLEKAPETVANFVEYVNSGFYEGTIFHRVIRGFMIQGGGLSAEMKPKTTGAPIANEGKNGLKNDRGAIAMARKGDPNSATAQFFINTVNNDNLNYPEPDGHGYAVFGRVVEGMDVVDAIERVPTRRMAGASDVPSDPIVIEKTSCREVG